MKDVSVSNMLQKYIPMILENDICFKQFVDYILEQYHFKVNEDHLRKKLHIYLKASHSSGAVALAQRLIKGEYKPHDRNKINWIWLSSKDIGPMAQNTFDKKLMI